MYMNVYARVCRIWLTMYVFTHTAPATQAAWQLQSYNRSSHPCVLSWAATSPERVSIDCLCNHFVMALYA
jgi:hypothetical protein